MYGGCAECMCYDAERLLGAGRWVGWYCSAVGNRRRRRRQHRTCKLQSDERKGDGGDVGRV